MLQLLQIYQLSNNIKTFNSRGLRYGRSCDCSSSTPYRHTCWIFVSVTLCGLASGLAATGEIIGSASISNDRIATYTYTNDANNNIAYIGISGTCTDGANAFATLNEDLPA